MACWSLSALGNQEGWTGPDGPYSPICWATTAATVASASSRGPQRSNQRPGLGSAQTTTSVSVGSSAGPPAATRTAWATRRCTSAWNTLGVM